MTGLVNTAAAFSGSATLKAASVPQPQIEAECSRLDRLRSSSGDGPAPGRVKEDLRALMWEKVGVEKNASDLRSALEDIERIRIELLPGMKIRNTGKSVNYEWLDAIDVMNMIDVCELVIHSSLEGRELRFEVAPSRERDDGEAAVCLCDVGEVLQEHAPGNVHI